MPDDFDPPRELEAPEFHLVPLGPQHNESDHAAWTPRTSSARSTTSDAASAAGVAQLALGRGKQLRDKRRDIAKREADRDMQRAIKSVRR